MYSKDIVDIYDELSEFQFQAKNIAFFFSEIFYGQKGLFILDTSCGTGMIDILLKKMGHTIYGTDISNNMIQKALENTSRYKESIVFKQANMLYVDKIGYKNMDVVLSLGNSISHLENEIELKNFFQSVYNVLSKEGIFVLNFMNHLVESEIETFFSSFQDGFFFYRIDNTKPTILKLFSFNKKKKECKRDNYIYFPFSFSTVKNILISIGFGDFHIYDGNYTLRSFSPSGSKYITLICKK